MLHTQMFGFCHHRRAASGDRGGGGSGGEGCSQLQEASECKSRGSCDLCSTERQWESGEVVATQ